MRGELNRGVLRSVCGQRKRETQRGFHNFVKKHDVLGHEREREEILRVRRVIN
jgi:hypothetical protein